MKRDYENLSCQKILSITTLGGNEQVVLRDILGRLLHAGEALPLLTLEAWPSLLLWLHSLLLHTLCPLMHYYCTFFPRITSNWRLMTWSQPQMTRWLLSTRLPTSPW